MPVDTRTWNLTAAAPTTDNLSPSDAFAGIVGLQITGTWTGTVTFQGTINGSTWVSVLAVPSDSTTAVTTTTANGIWRIDAAGYQAVRANFTTPTSGTVVVRAFAGIG